MNVLLISECDKRALTETRRILDQFAERCGVRTWQTAITWEGLDALRKLLRKTARKNTAVACHWIRGRDHSELLWIVGDASRFNSEGIVPTNITTRDIIRAEDENDWHTGEVIRLLAQLAALLHDLGKASVAFQRRLINSSYTRNLVRHEWVSLRLFLAFVGDDDDETWLKRLTEDSSRDESIWTSPERYLHDEPGRLHKPFEVLTQRAPIAAAIGWLIVTHHRLPAIPPADSTDSVQYWGKRRGVFSKNWLKDPLAAINCEWNEIIDPGASSDQVAPYWQLAGSLPIVDPTWHKQAARCARTLLNLMPRHSSNWLSNVWALHLARLILMLADHYYSGLGFERDGRPVAERLPYVKGEQQLFANTYISNGKTQFKQSLLEHLLGVGASAAQIAHALPGFERHLPHLANHRGLRKRSSHPRFAWQDRAFDAAAAMREISQTKGAFIVDMASTGCGKTLANARILYALADPQIGLRASFALGLRTLTLQTGRAYRKDLTLGDDELAVLVGGAANRLLFEFHHQQAEMSGSASTQALLEEDSHILYEGSVTDHPLLSRALADSEIRKLLSAPLLVCTVDHLIPASESMRGGRQIAPLLRLMSSDLVLDELDDYDMNDLPALSRLVFFAGMAGSRVLLSSATLPPSLVQGMFRAYQAGRLQYSLNRGELAPDAAREVPCLWVDEFGKPLRKDCYDADTFLTNHESFTEQRIKKLQDQPPLRVARLQNLEISIGQKREAIRSEFAEYIWQAAWELHSNHHDVDPVSGVCASFGLVRMANIDPLADVAKALISRNLPPNAHLHLCVYHSQFPLAQRSEIEAMLDAVFDRRDSGVVWKLPWVREVIDPAPCGDHLFVVLASPVCEVGRDWDVDWAVAEPSSMRSIIQLAGRVNRHRNAKKNKEPNMVVFDTNLKALEIWGKGKAAFIRPGFEKEDLWDADQCFLLSSHRLALLRHDLAELAAGHSPIDAVPRIKSFPNAVSCAKDDWVALEHARMEVAMRPIANELLASARSPSGRPKSSGWRAPERDQACLAWQFPQLTLLGVLAQEQPFREETHPDRTLVFLPDEHEEELVIHRVEPKLARNGQSPYVAARELLRNCVLECGHGVRPWGLMSQEELLERIKELSELEGLSLLLAAAKFTAVQVPRERSDGKGWSWHPWLGFGSYTD